ncbi:glycosyltransferase family 1 protein [Goekera deserti]|uniref:rhamnosyltransferase WsaF family glycosyltransferase n=1 Tax=Goekera deserti TaxID=2497753 RepID=UPI001877A175|nr:glycosyltransferase family 1 protein [Goekera deserti]
MNVVGTASKGVRTLRQEGWEGVAERLVRAANRRLNVAPEALLLRPEEIVDSATLAPAPVGPTRAPGSPLDIGWVLTPPAAGSGGHTTVFRMVRALEQAGHRCVLYLVDVAPADLPAREAVIRAAWPEVVAPVRAVADGLPSLDAHVATAWQTAHVLARHTATAGRRFYLVQDYEPYFYGRGAVAALAEDTYRFGFQVISIGHMVAEELHDRFGVQATVAPFGTDLDTYGLLDPRPRDEVVFYARPGAARRGYELGVWSLELFAARRPDVVINTFGSAGPRLPFPVRAHTHLSPAELNVLYNRCAAGLALSFTNISLIAAELLAAGAVPVVNDSPGPRADLDNPHVRWARPTPAAVAAALEHAVDAARSSSPTEISHSVRGTGWEPAGRAVVRAIEAACAGQAPPPTASAPWERGHVHPMGDAESLFDD